MGRSTVHYADNETNNILKRLHNKLRPAGTPVERVEYIIELLLLRIFEVKLRHEEAFKPLRKLFEGDNYLLFSNLLSLSNGDRILSELNKNIFPFYATILQEARKVIKGNLQAKMQDQLVLMEEVFANSNFTNNVKGGVITEVIGLVNEIDEKYILKTDLLGDAIESALSETGGTKDLGLYRTPDHIRQMMVAMIDPDFTDIVFDPACGTAGFLFDTYDYVINKSNETGVYPSTNIANMFYRTGIGGIEYQGRIRKMAAVNMYIRGLNPHNIMQGDSLKMYDPARDAGSKTVVIANPPFGAERDQPAYPNVWEEYSKESETTILFVKLMFDYLKAGGRCAVVVSEGFLTWGQGSACALRKILLNEANLRAIISLPQGVFVSKSGQGAKTSILYFEKGQPTDFVWYYKIENDGFSMGTNRKPIEGSQIPELLAIFKEIKQGKKPEDTPRSFCIDREQIETLDPQIIERITSETREKTTERNDLKRNKKIIELDKKLSEKKINKTIYTEELSQFDSNLEAQIENEIAKAIEKAHTYHFNMQNYRANDDDKPMEYEMINLGDILYLPQKEKVGSQDIPILSVTMRDGLVEQSEKFGKRIASADISGYTLVRKNQLVVGFPIDEGVLSFQQKYEMAAVSPAYTIWAVKNENDVNIKFLELILRSEKLREVYRLKMTGTAGRRRIISKDSFVDIQIPLPPLKIQNEFVEKIEKQKKIIAEAQAIVEKESKELAVIWTLEEKSFLKRKILATYIINQSLNDSNFGDVKFEKLFYLSEYFAIKRNFGQKYYVQAAGPYDNVFTREYFRQIEQAKWFNRQRKNNQYIFTIGEKHDKSLNTYSMFSNNELERVNKLISYFKKSDYEQPEIIATLYAVWNNRIIRQELITDEVLKEDFLNWDAQKIKYKDRLDNALKWMRENEIVPDGWGKVIEKVEKKKTTKK